jgi:hypothetical protein
MFSIPQSTDRRPRRLPLACWLVELAAACANWRREHTLFEMSDIRLMVFTESSK